VELFVKLPVSVEPVSCGWGLWWMSKLYILPHLEVASAFASLLVENITMEMKVVEISKVKQHTIHCFPNAKSIF
jgi:hypothetical protein